jgi:hypothetical protein
MEGIVVVHDFSDLFLNRDLAATLGPSTLELPEPKFP